MCCVVLVWSLIFTLSRLAWRTLSDNDESAHFVTTFQPRFHAMLLRNFTESSFPAKMSAAKKLDKKSFMKLPHEIALVGNFFLQFSSLSNFVLHLPKKMFFKGFVQLDTFGENG
jgi:hypothetical protein